MSERWPYGYHRDEPTCVSRSSCTCFLKQQVVSIGQIAAKLVAGFTPDELMNDITGGVTPASFEPTIDYVVTKIPRFNFEKFVESNRLSNDANEVGW